MKDWARLIADVRKGDEAALTHAYREVFDTELGRLVLAHHLAECGVGARMGREALEYAAGRHDAGLDLAERAGFDQASIAVGILSDRLEGTENDTAFNHPPEPEDGPAWLPGEADDF